MQNQASEIRIIESHFRGFLDSPVSLCLDRVAFFSAHSPFDSSDDHDGITTDLSTTLDPQIDSIDHVESQRSSNTEIIDLECLSDSSADSPLPCNPITSELNNTDHLPTIPTFATQIRRERRRKLAAPLPTFFSSYSQLQAHLSTQDSLQDITSSSLNESNHISSLTKDLKDQKSEQTNSSGIILPLDHIHHQSDKSHDAHVFDANDEDWFEFEGEIRSFLSESNFVPNVSESCKTSTYDDLGYDANGKMMWELYFPANKKESEFCTVLQPPTNLISLLRRLWNLYPDQTFLFVEKQLLFILRQLRHRILSPSDPLPPWKFYQRPAQPPCSITPSSTNPSEPTPNISNKIEVINHRDMILLTYRPNQSIQLPIYGFPLESVDSMSIAISERVQKYYKSFMTKIQYLSSYVDELIRGAPNWTRQNIETHQTHPFHLYGQNLEIRLEWVSKLLFRSTILRHHSIRWHLRRASYVIRQLASIESFEDVKQLENLKYFEDQVYEMDSKSSEWKHRWALHHFVSCMRERHSPTKWPALYSIHLAPTLNQIKNEFEAKQSSTLGQKWPILTSKHLNRLYQQYNFSKVDYGNQFETDMKNQSNQNNQNNQHNQQNQNNQNNQHHHQNQNLSDQIQNQLHDQQNQIHDLQNNNLIQNNHGRSILKSPPCLPEDLARLVRATLQYHQENHSLSDLHRQIQAIERQASKSNQIAMNNKSANEHGEAKLLTDLLDQENEEIQFCGDWSDESDADYADDSGLDDDYYDEEEEEEDDDDEDEHEHDLDADLDSHHRSRNDDHHPSTNDLTDEEREIERMIQSKLRNATQEERNLARVIAAQIYPSSQNHINQNQSNVCEKKQLKGKSSVEISTAAINSLEQTGNFQSCQTNKASRGLCNVVIEHPTQKDDHHHDHDQHQHHISTSNEEEEPIHDDLLSNWAQIVGRPELIKSVEEYLDKQGFSKSDQAMLFQAFFNGLTNSKNREDDEFDQSSLKPLPVPSTPPPPYPKHLKSLQDHEKSLEISNRSVLPKKNKSHDLQTNDFESASNHDSDLYDDYDYDLEDQEDGKEGFDHYIEVVYEDKGQKSNSTMSNEIDKYHDSDNTQSNRSENTTQEDQIKSTQQQEQAQKPYAYSKSVISKLHEMKLNDPFEGMSGYKLRLTDYLWVRHQRVCAAEEDPYGNNSYFYEEGTEEYSDQSSLEDEEATEEIQDDNSTVSNETNQKQQNSNHYHQNKSNNQQNMSSSYSNQMGHKNGQLFNQKSNRASTANQQQQQVIIHDPNAPDINDTSKSVDELLEYIEGGKASKQKKKKAEKKNKENKDSNVDKEKNKEKGKEKSNEKNKEKEKQKDKQQIQQQIQQDNLKSESDHNNNQSIQTNSSSSDSHEFPEFWSIPADDPLRLSEAEEKAIAEEALAFEESLLASMSFAIAPSLSTSSTTHLVTNPLGNPKLAVEKIKLDARLYETLSSLSKSDERNLFKKFYKPQTTTQKMDSNQPKKQQSNSKRKANKGRK